MIYFDNLYYFYYTNSALELLFFNVSGNIQVHSFNRVIRNKQAKQIMEESERRRK